MIINCLFLRLSTHLVFSYFGKWFFFSLRRPFSSWLFKYNTNTTTTPVSLFWQSLYSCSIQYENGTTLSSFSFLLFRCKHARVTPDALASRPCVCRWTCTFCFFFFPVDDAAWRRSFRVAVLCPCVCVCVWLRAGLFKYNLLYIIFSLSLFFHPRSVRHRIFLYIPFIFTLSPLSICFIDVIFTSPQLSVCPLYHSFVYHSVVEFD